MTLQMPFNTKTKTARRIQRSSNRRFQEYLDAIRVRRKSKGPDESGADHHGFGRGSTLERSNRSFAKLFREFWKMLAGYRVRIALGLWILTLTTLMSLLPPLATKLAIDSVLTSPPLPPPAFLQPWIDGWTPMQLLWGIAIATAIVTLVRTAIHLSGRWMMTQTVNLFTTSLRRRLFQHILHLPLHRIYKLKSGGATSMLREDAGGVSDLVFSMLYNPWQAVVQLLGSLVILVLVDWRLLVTGLLLLPLVYWSHRWYIHSIRPLYRDVRKQRQDVDATTTESFGGIRVVRTFARQRTETKRYIDGQHLLTRQQLMVWWRTRLIEIIWEVLIPLASTGLLIYGGWQIIQGQLTLGDLMMFLVYLTMLLGPIATLAGSAVQFQNGLAGLDRILDIFEVSPELPDRPKAITINRNQVVGAMRLQNVSFKYPGSDTWVLRDVTMSVQENQTIALVGRSGAGKTTLCNLIARFYDPEEGSIELDGTDLRDTKLHSYRKLLGMVEQDVFLFDGTIAENIAFSRRGASMESIRAAAAAAAADEFIDKLPDGYDSLIGERGVKLSGGQRQRLAIARAMLADPKILILDEATSNLDSESEQLIQRSLNQLRQNRTTFVIAHRLSTITSADQIWVMSEGRIIENGTHESLMSEGGAYEKMVRLQTSDAIVIS
jgi:ATP-binding cassette subfamily B protein/subfamily B ATP-binding cassette protein MsbA